MNPLISLIIGLSVLLIFGFIVWPDTGLIARKRKLKIDAKRVLIEDALKHLYDCEYKNTICTLNSISDTLAISYEKAVELVNMLGDMKLVNVLENSLQLTQEGRSYALRIIRIHRLWEKYLADHTGLDSTEWHKEAELKEHSITDSQLNDLAAQLGNPLRDPHGDPIPSRDLTMPEKKGIPISMLKKGEFATIVHLEDEPREVYSQLVAIGLYPGMQVRMLEQNALRIVFEADGEECVIAPVFASNITVLPIEQKENIKESFNTLSSLKQGQSATIVGISNAIRGMQRRRLLDFGLVPGTKITALLNSYGKDPVAYEVRSTIIALRKSQTDFIYVKDIREEK
ncbi:FeoA domain-containing protein [Melioribacteraceae bacterium 4301-Me]|uniref:metal-dependent transcriptional regulator n=1 Tax=Pyranulibacter aquaticus TaxID=3163344 RepID=UPI0035993381